MLTHLPWAVHVNPARFDVLAEMALNLGWPKLTAFRLTLHDVAVGDYAGAATKMLQSGWASDVSARAQTLARQMRRGQY